MNSMHSNPNQTFGEHPASGPAPTTAGHHKHDILNKLDPRVDSSMDHQPVATMAVTEGSYVHGLHEGHPHNNIPSMHGAAGPSTGTTEFHYDNIYNNDNSYNNNRMDNPNAHVPVPPPQQQHHKHRGGFHHGVDVATNSSTITAAGQGHGLGGVGKASPAHQHYMGSPTSTNVPLPGPAPNTAGPHSSDLLNKLDPKVDSRGGHWEKY